MKLIISFSIISVISLSVLLFKGNVEACTACSGMMYNPAFSTCCNYGPPDFNVGGGDVCCPGGSGTRECLGDYVNPVPFMCAF